jgi:hypothetical protein
LGLAEGDVFIKFGKPEHMRSLHERGALRLQPASYFADQSHNGAIRDDELSLSISLKLSRDDIIGIVQNPQDVPPDAPEQRLDVTFESPSDYLLYCVTTSVNARLFVDFSAQACVIIRDRARFTRMLRDATIRELGRCDMFEGAAIYVDPLLPTTAKVFVPYAKHFRYAYQQEHRYCWLPGTQKMQMLHKDIEIGSIADFADLILL